MRQLHELAGDSDPQCIWRKDGSAAELFMFLADRCCGAPDHVLDCESQHAQWKTLELGRKGLTFKVLNALLKLRNFHTMHGELPPYEDLEDQLEAISVGHAARYAALIADPNIHPRQVRDMMYRSRFNLRAIDQAIIHNVDDESDDDAIDDGNAQVDVAFSNYVRFLFEPRNLYSFTVLNPNKFVYITENKSIAYRDKNKPDHAIGRHINVVWYEVCGADDDVDADLNDEEALLVPCNDAGESLPMQGMTLAELSLTAGFYPNDVLPHHTERDVELIHENNILEQNVERFESRPVRLTTGKHWSRIVNVNSGVDMEWHAFDERSIRDLTKMALARALQVRDGLSKNERQRIYGLSKNVLLHALETILV